MDSTTEKVTEVDKLFKKFIKDIKNLNDGTETFMYVMLKKSINLNDTLIAYIEKLNRKFK